MREGHMREGHMRVCWRVDNPGARVGAGAGEDVGVRCAGRGRKETRGDASA